MRAPTPVPPLIRPPAVPAAIFPRPDHAGVLRTRHTPFWQVERDGVRPGPLVRVVDAHQLGTERRAGLVSGSRPDLPRVVVAEREEDDVVAHVCGSVPSRRVC
jgi:hypothetical protein